MAKKVHTLTKSSCISCDESINDTNSIFIHSTRRQTHQMCVDCLIGYTTPILQIITENLRKRLNTDNFITCCGTYHGILRNKCKEKMSVESLYYRIMKIKDKFPDKFVSDITRIVHVSSCVYLHICKNSECGVVIEIDPAYYGESSCACPTCKESWCLRCPVTPFHKDKTCLEYEVEQRNTDNGKFIWDMREAGKIKFCPKCRSPILKNDGCNKITCVGCNSHWCWLCSKENIDYDHFNSESSNPCANKLWQ